jgi:polyisoprenyl-phosphate glycosyltransferase
MTVPEPPFRLAVVTPVFNDWVSLSILMERISVLYRLEAIEFFVAAVDDGSTDPVAALGEGIVGVSCIRSLEIIRLVTNLGHQRAIAIGLAQVATWPNIDAVLVMDSDGEDRPEDISALVDASRGNRDAVILAERSKRSETTIFKVGYYIYRRLFRMLTGRNISSGNFVLIPMSLLKGLTFTSNLWNNLAATLIRSRYHLVNVPTVRGERYAGRSQMDLVSLVTHGLGSISVYVDVIFVRLLLCFTGIMGFAALSIILVICYKLFINLSTPGWATTVLSMFLIIMFQAGIFVVGATLMLLGDRSNYTVIPALDCYRFIERRRDAQSGEARAHSEENGPRLDPVVYPSGSLHRP